MSIAAPPRGGLVGTSALRLRDTFVISPFTPSTTVGLVDLAFWCPTSKLLPFGTFSTLGFGMCGLVARFATTECPLWLGERVGDVTFGLLNLTAVGTETRGWVFGFGGSVRNSIFCCCSWIAVAAVGSTTGSSSSSS